MESITKKVSAEEIVKMIDLMRAINAKENPSAYELAWMNGAKEFLGINK